MDQLPYELVVVVCSYLDPLSAARFQRTAKRYLDASRSNGNSWFGHCFDTSLFYKAFRRRRAFRLDEDEGASSHTFVGLAISLGQTRLNESTKVLPRKEARARILANWDPSYSTEKVDWYTEFVHRNAPICVNWLQQPRSVENSTREPLEVRGVGVFNPSGSPEKNFALSPLDDGSVCLWDLAGSCGRKGAIVARSVSGAVSIPGAQDARSKMINTGVVECVTVDSNKHKAYIAIQSDLVEIDLETMQAVSQQKFPFSICALSEARGLDPITVGTNLSLHLYDPRDRLLFPESSGPDGVEPVSSNQHGESSHEYGVSSQPNSKHAPLFRPTPLSILHVEKYADCWDAIGDIYVCGRFPSLLVYDRRTFPRLKSTIHSGARLCSMTSIPYAFNSADRERRRQGELSVEQANTIKAKQGVTIVAGGEYNSKGSLELYGLTTLDGLDAQETDAANRNSFHSFYKNRQTCSSSKILSVVNHGTKLVFSDGGGNLKWVERDGFMEVRRWNVATGSTTSPRGIFGTLGDNYMESQAGDIVRKILPTAAPRLDQAPNKDDLLLWTGEKLGMLSLSSKPEYSAESFEERQQSLEDRRKENQERVYSQTMRRALEQQANEARYVRGLGLGLARPE